MSTIRDPAVITNAGRQMMTAGGDISYTKAVLYGQDISHLTKEQLEGLTSIGDPLITVPVGISDKSNNGNGTTVVIEATFQNSNLKADLPYTAIAFFAKKGEDAEKLITVGVATDGSYLAAASPDGVATDALDVKLAIAIGDASNVTTVIDPAGSVTPATLNAAISKVTHDLTAKIDVKADQDDTEKSLATKADKTTVESDLATKADQSSLDETNAEVAKKADSEDVTKQLATKANASDVTDNVKTLQANIDTKADKATVDAEIAKIDFTPYAKSADVANELQNYTTTVDLNKLLAGKEDAGTSYSKAELDKKLLTLSTDPDGKVNADQVSSMIANKVDKSDLASDLKSINDSIATKANTTDVNTALAKKDDTTDVDAKIKTVTDLANTKASQADFDSLKTLVNNVKSFNVDSFKGSIPTTDINKITDSGLYGFANQTLTNSPFSGNRWGLLLVLREYDNDANNIDQFITSNGNLYWRNISLSNSSYPSWKRFVNDGDINSLQSAINSTISALQQTVQSLQNTVNQQATQITGLQTQVNNQANEIKQLQETTIKGKTFSKSQEAAAEAWEQQNSQQIAFILDN